MTGVAMLCSSLATRTQAVVWKGAKPWVSAIMPMIEPMAATIVTIQQMASSTCRPHHLADHIGILFCTMCIWICITGQVIKVCVFTSEMNGNNSSSQTEPLSEETVPSFGVHMALCTSTEYCTFHLRVQATQVRSPAKRLSGVQSQWHLQT